MNRRNEKVLSRINAKLGKLEAENHELEQEIDRLHQDDADYRHSLSVSHGDIEADITKLYSIEGQHENSELVLNARYYRYIMGNCYGCYYNGNNENIYKIKWYDNKRYCWSIYSFCSVYYIILSQ